MLIVLKSGSFNLLEPSSPVQGLFTCALLYMKAYLDTFMTVGCRQILNIFYPEIRTVYETMGKNIVQPGRPQMAVKYSAYELNARYLRLQIYTQNMYYFLLFLRNGGYLNVTFIFTTSYMNICTDATCSSAQSVQLLFGVPGNYTCRRMSFNYTLITNLMHSL